MKISITSLGHKTVIKIAGRFDSCAHAEFRLAYEQLLRQSTLTTLEVEMEGIEHFDSSSLGMLMRLHEYAQTFEKRVLLSKPNQRVLRILEQANFNRLFAIT